MINKLIQILQHYLFKEQKTQIKICLASKNF